MVLCELNSSSHSVGRVLSYCFNIFSVVIVNGMYEHCEYLSVETNIAPKIYYYCKLFLTILRFYFIYNTIIPHLVGV